MTPIERACRALCELDGHPPGITMDGKPLWMDYLLEARAVITAIQEPSEAMVNAAVLRGQANGYTDVVGQHRAMIDAMIEEGA